MVDIITDHRLIAKYQKAFVARLKTVCDQKISCKVGYKGSSDNVVAFYSSKYNFWFTTNNNFNRYWNAFGIGRPSEGKSNSIVVEINPPYEGINRSTGGVFAKSNNGEVLILHRGKIGGGREGIGKRLFFEQYRGTPITCNDDGIEGQFCLIGSISSKYLPKQLSNFIVNVARIKTSAHLSSPSFSDLADFKFSDEKFGTNEISKKGQITINRVHGIVVNALAEQIEKEGLSVGNDCNRDLFIHKRGRIVTLFEIKANSSPQSLYAAVGQLLIYSIPIKTEVNLVMVLPDKLTTAVTNRLKQLGIKVLYYSWNTEGPVFEQLTDYI